MTRVDETWHRLLEWTSGSTNAERLAGQILADEGYEGFDPSHPLGGQDGGKDGLAEKKGKHLIVAVWFPRGQQSENDLKKKFADDWKGVAKNNADGMVFVTNQEILNSARDSLRNSVRGSVHLYHLERVMHVVDRPGMAPIKKQYLDLEIEISPTGLSPRKRLDELRRASEARCMERWMALGLPRNEATQLAQDHDLGKLSSNSLPSGGRPVVVLSAEMGSGKSLAAERYHQGAISDYQAGGKGPAPVYLASGEVKEGLEKAVVAATTELDDPRSSGARVVVDGLDELGFEAAAEMLGQARRLSSTWPDTSVLLTTRPSVVDTSEEESVSVDPLNEEESLRLVCLGAGREVPLGWLHGTTTEVRRMIRRPFFAILTGVWMRENQGSPASPVEILDELSRRASRENFPKARLREFAVKSISRNHVPVADGEVGTSEEVRELIACGIVVRRQGGLVFTLPGIAQWFGAQALLREEINVSVLLEAPEDLPLWRYPIAIAIAFGSSEKALRLLDPLFDARPGFALQILNTAFSQTLLEGTVAPPWREAGRLIREALVTIFKGVGNIVRLLPQTMSDGSVCPIAVSSSNTLVDVAYWRGTEPKPDVFPFPADFDFTSPPFSWSKVVGSRVGPGATWAWRWARNEIQQDLGKLIKYRSIPLPLRGPLSDEALWAFACDHAGANNLFSESIELSVLSDRLEEIVRIAGERPLSISGIGSASYDFEGLERAISARVDTGALQLENPLPVADLQGGTGFVGGFYSEDRLVEVATVLHEKAIVGYRQLVNDWFNELEDDLELNVLLPVEMVREIDPNRDGAMPMPVMHGFEVALPPDQQSRVSASIVTEHEFDMEKMREIGRQQRTQRPLSSRWIGGHFRSGVFDVGSRLLISSTAYYWLTRDLRRIGLVDSPFHSTNPSHIGWDFAS